MELIYAPNGLNGFGKQLVWFVGYDGPLVRVCTWGSDTFCVARENVYIP